MIVAICDNDTNAVKRLEDIIKHLQKDILISKFNSIQDFVDTIENENRIDIVFMNIDWGEEKTGIDYIAELSVINPQMQIIYITNDSERYSEKIFLRKVNLCGFLIKPVRKEFVETVLNNAIEAAEINNKEYMIINKNRQIRAILCREILYLESSIHHVTVHTIREKITFYGQLENERKNLPNYFIKSHKSYVVNINYIRNIDDKIHLINDEIIDISRSCRAEVKKIFTEYILHHGIS